MISIEKSDINGICVSLACGDAMEFVKLERDDSAMKIRVLCD